MMPFTYAYSRPALTVDTIVFRKIDGDLQVLLIQRRNQPFEGSWAIPGGFVDIDELLVDAAARELYEETGLKQLGLKPTVGLRQKLKHHLKVLLCALD